MTGTRGKQASMGDVKLLFAYADIDFLSNDHKHGVQWAAGRETRETFRVRTKGTTPAYACECCHSHAELLP